MLLHDGISHACLVDASLVLEDLARLPDLHEMKSIVTIIGYVENAEVGNTFLSV